MMKINMSGNRSTRAALYNIKVCWGGREGWVGDLTCKASSMKPTGVETRKGLMMLLPLSCVLMYLMV